MRWLCVFSVILAVISISFVKRSKNNVCRTFDDYYTDRDQNKNCYHNPDGELTVPQVIRRWGYPVEIHYAITEDGYILTLFRIPHGRDSISKNPGQPVLLQHGYKSNSKCFVTTGNKSLGFILADAGYDVWLGNFRGTTYARDHTYLSNSNETYWNFSFHEFGMYDTPAQVDLVNNVTRQKIIFIGFSMGNTAAVIYSSTYPDIAERKVKIFIKLAPFIYTDSMSSFTLLGLRIWPYMAPLVQAVTGGQYYTKRYSRVNTALWNLLCYPYPFQMKMCQYFDMKSLGFDYEQNDPETLPVTLLQLTETTTVKMILHLSHLAASEDFHQFDYGTVNNMKIYGRTEAPRYNFSNMRVPAYIIRSDNDMMTTKEATERFYASLPKKVKPYDIYVVPHNKFNHMDFVWAKDVVHLLYNHLLTFMNSL